MLSFAISAICALIASSVLHAAAYTLPDNGDSVVGVVTTMRLKYEDTLAEVAERYGVGYQELLDANPDIDPWLPGEGTVIRLPTAYVLPNAPRQGIVINVAEYRLYYYEADAPRVITYPVGIGRTDFPTPLIETRVVGRIENPSWTPTESARKEHAEWGDILPPVVPPGPDNPLGKVALQLSTPGYFIHGTNKPFGVGQMVSHGCIRLYAEHIATLAEMVPNGTPVYIVNQPFKLGWRDSALYAETHPEMYTASQHDTYVEEVRKAASGKLASVDWQLLDQELQGPTGVPVRL